MNDELSENEKVELERRRSAELVTDMVESALKRRYTWIGIIVAIAAFLGSTAIIKAVTADLQAQIAVGTETLKRIESQADDVDQLSKTARSKLTTLDATIEERFNKLDLKLEEKSEDLDELFDARKRGIDNLDRILIQIEDIRVRVDDLTAIVEILVKGSDGEAGPGVEENLTRNLEDLKIEQKALGELLYKSNEQIRLSQYSVYVHVAEEEATDEILGEDLGNFLSDTGFVVPKVQSVALRSRSIRYFHEQDRKGALRVQQSAHDFLRARDLPDVEIKVRDFTGYTGKKPRIGIIELWIYL